MNFFFKMLLSHVLIVVVALGALLLFAELLAPAFVRGHVEQMVALIGPRGAELRPDLERGVRGTLTSALLASLPLALLVAAVTALPSARRVVRSVGLLSEGSRALASGRYERRLPEEGNDELTDLARSFNRMAAALGQVEQERTDLITNVAHELRTPIAALRGYTEALADGVMEPKAARAALQREVSALERLAHDLSLVSRVERGTLELHVSTFPPADLLQAARERFEGAYDEKGVVLAVQVTSDLPQVRADFGRAAQVLANLLTNALRHTPRVDRSPPAPPLKAPSCGSSSRTPEAGSLRSTCPGCSSASTGWTPHVPVGRAAAGWASPLHAAWSSVWAGRSARRVPPARAAALPSRCPPQFEGAAAVLAEG